MIGGYESGADAAFHLASAGKLVRVLDRAAPWTLSESDPSVALSPFTHDRPQSVNGAVELVAKAKVHGVTRTNGHFTVIAKDGRRWGTASQPILAAGFTGGLAAVKDHFTWTRAGRALLTECDESTRTPGLFVVGPQVRHKNVIFCFIYKYRQRFAVVENEIARRLDRATEPLEVYRHEQMLLDDLSCCGEECAC